MRHDPHWIDMTDRILFPTAVITVHRCLRGTVPDYGTSCLNCTLRGITHAACHLRSVNRNRFFSHQSNCLRGNWTSREYAKSRTGQLAVSQMPPKERKLSTQSRRWHPRVDQSASRPVRELAIRELSSNRLRTYRGADELAYPPVVHQPPQYTSACFEWSDCSRLSR